MTPAPARSHRRTQNGRPVAPRAPRRVSGPASRRMVAAPAGAASGSLRSSPGAGGRRGTTGLFARVRALPEHRVVDRLLRSRLWIWALGALLGGIVTMQVSLLKLNSGISRAVETTTTLERQNAALEAAIARLSAPDRIQVGADALGMVMPPAGEVRYVRPGAGDAERAARRMQPPSDEAAAVLANGGIVPGSLAGPAATLTGTATTAPATTTDPAAATGVPATDTAGTGAPPAGTTTPDPATESPAAAAGQPATGTTTTTSQAPPAGGAVAGQG